MRLALIACLCSCDQVFGIDPIAPTSDASGFDAIVLDTTGWPTDGGVDAKPCVTAADEDKDGRVDDCDNCPADVGPQDDRDRDGVGDLCDPHPDYAVERLAAFFAFNDPTLPGIAISDQGDWAIGSGALRQRGLTSGRALFVLDGTWNKPTVEIKAKNWSRSQATATNWYVGVMLIDDPTVTTLLPDEVNCRAHFTGAGNGQFEMMRIRNEKVGVSTSAPFQKPNSVLTIAQTSPRHGAPPLCDGERVDQPPSQLIHVLLTPEASDSLVPSVGLWTSAATAEFTSVTVYETIFD